jgi:hypothetical protein
LAFRGFQHLNRREVAIIAEQRMLLRAPDHAGSRRTR